MHSKCCAPNEVTIIVGSETRTKASAAYTVAVSTITHTPPSSSDVVPAMLPKIKVINAARPLTPDSLTPGQAARVAVINLRLNHNRLASTEIVSTNTVLHENRPSTT